MHQKMELRKQRIRAKCQQMELARSIDSANLIVLKYRKLIWCPIFKAASSWWMQQIPWLTNYKASQIQLLSQKYIQANTLAQAVAPQLSSSKLKWFLSSQNPVKFLIVRHPFDRLLSAYRDKFESRNEYFHVNYGKQMVNKYRQAGTARFGLEFYKRGGKFNGCPLGDVDCVQRRGSGSTPTFWEFIQAILYHGISNGHWNPSTQSCKVCLLQYDFILHFEDLKTEQKYMLQMLNLTSKVVHSNGEKVHQNKRILNQTEKKLYFQMLNATEFQDLLSYYGQDFQLFNYDPYQYR